MSKPSYSFDFNVTPEQYKLLTQMQVHTKVNNPDVFIKIVEILINNGFRPFSNGMRREETGCGFEWITLMKYETVVDFQIEWGYA